MGPDDVDHLGGRSVLDQNGGGAEAQRKDGKSAKPEGEGERRRADAHVLRRDAEDLLGIAVGNDQEIAMEMHGRLGLAGGAGSEAEEGDIVAAGLHGAEHHVFAQRNAVELGVVIGGAVKADHLFEELAAAGAIDEFVHQARVAERERYFGLVDDLAQFAGAKERHGIDDNGAGLGGGDPARDQRRIIGGADQNAIARLDAELLDQRTGDAVGPVRELSVSAAAAVADQRDAVTEAARHHAIGQFNARVQLFGVTKTVQRNLRPQVRRRQVVARERIDMRGTPERVECGR